MKTFVESLLRLKPAESYVREINKTIWWIARRIQNINKLLFIQIIHCWINSFNKTDIIYDSANYSLYIYIYIYIYARVCMSSIFHPLTAPHELFDFWMEGSQKGAVFSQAQLEPSSKERIILKCYLHFLVKYSSFTGNFFFSMGFPPTCSSS